jgi:hypothetical protein
MRKKKPNTPKKEMKDDINKWENIPYSWTGKPNVQSKLQIQCDF